MPYLDKHGISFSQGDNFVGQLQLSPWDPVEEQPEETSRHEHGNCHQDPAPPVKKVVLHFEQ